ncbi:MAG TPA: metalloregulator ArsR/SmtB family transcription factor [Acidimicrobiales bacterium]|nr:metalloregulator ArsR/SmtB family transcription factor [Acidimicrobiales bacterium]
MTAVAVLTGAKRRLVERLKRLDGATAAELAVSFELTPAAVRQHLDDLAAAGLVEADPSPPPTGSRGRPAQRWRLTAAAAALFPDHHADLVVSLLEVLRGTLGEAGIDDVVDARTRAQLDAYRSVLPDPAASPVGERVEALARVRSVEGYMAEAVALPEDDGYLLVEHHCPICAAAESCQNLCRGELDLFRAALGDDVHVERSQHLLAGDQRCAYRVTRRR